MNAIFAKDNWFGMCSSEIAETIKCHVINTSLVLSVIHMVRGHIKIFAFNGDSKQPLDKIYLQSSIYSAPIHANDI